jgi:hypothetical protein
VIWASGKVLGIGGIVNQGEEGVAGPPRTMAAANNIAGNA